ncbi:MAG: NTP transferase domain-containing protein [Acidobacteria bacterium]|jgi:NDP-sugar pyrophosphorylase family protein|nr:NTP transferase domain-containing protein [Acidobacteriota bacterium]
MGAYSGIILAGEPLAYAQPALRGMPRSMSPVAKRPFLEYMLTRLRIGGITDVVLCVGYKRSHIQSHIRKGRKWGLQVRYSVEKERLGTAGAVKQAGDLLAAPEWFVFKGDSLLDFDVQAMREFHQERRAMATVALVSRAGHYGRVVLNERHEIAAFRDKKEGAPGCGGKCLINAGVYLLSRRCLDLVPSGRPVSLENEIFPALIGSGLYGFRSAGNFIDVNVPEDLSRAQYELSMRPKT